MSPEFLLAALVVVASPGTGAVYTIAAALTRGARARGRSGRHCLHAWHLAAYGLFAAQMRDRVLSRPRVMAWLLRGFAAAFLALGAKLALTERQGAVCSIAPVAERRMPSSHSRTPSTAAT